MISDSFLQLVQRSLPFELTEVQRDVVRRMSNFIFKPADRSAYLLRGYAGTGKTFVMAAIVKVLHHLHRPVVLLAPTGRAAKVFSLHAGYPAYTIHKEIYRQRKRGDIDSHFDIDQNKHKDTVFIVDEASMISNDGGSGIATFGTGCLLNDLVTYVYSSPGNRLVLLGDNAQLPPVGEDESPALNLEVLRSLDLNVSGYQLTTVMRQAEQSGILYNATNIRKLLHSQSSTDQTGLRPRLGHHAPQPKPDLDLKPVRDRSMVNGQRSMVHVKLDGFSDVVRISGSEMAETLESDYGRYGMEQVVVVTRSNKRAVEYNLGIRNIIFGREADLTPGDVIMVVRNNYYWLERLASERKTDVDDPLPTSFLANGDIGVVRRIIRRHEFYGLHFADVIVRFPDYDDLEMEVRVLLDALTSESPSLTAEQSDRLYAGVLEDYAEIRTKAERLRKLRMDPNYNALQIKYAYAVTCHKAQGGQWRNVYIDQGWLPPDGIDRSYYRWLYTAFTRATDRLYLVNWPE